MSNIMLTLNQQKEAFEEFKEETSQALKNIEELLQLVVMSKRGSSERKKSVDEDKAYLKAQRGTVDSVLTQEVLNKTGAFVVSKCVIEYVTRRVYGLQCVQEPMEFLNFAPHPSIRKQAATSELGTAFNRMKMRMLKSYVTNSVQSANHREREQEQVTCGYR